jgi:hypothetical protein
MKLKSVSQKEAWHGLRKTMLTGSDKRHLTLVPPSKTMELKSNSEVVLEAVPQGTPNAAAVAEALIMIPVVAKAVAAKRAGNMSDREFHAAIIARISPSQVNHG